ncbi:hypothetical protein PVAND_015800 [Polypedilum vanderplanki]|uniref:Uncharacterized protein n=1 Tax=Polypedilum vanderplanki TaxID=319348 RepID=A0A9J6BDY5_POLVA|nr:hypothetical protein PVAND_015800 [Polypedilum vanderplanki]
MKVSLQTSVIQLIGICVCGYALKKSNPELIYATSILIYSLVHFILGLIIYSNPIASNKLVLIYDKSTNLSSCLYIPLVNIQLLTHHNVHLYYLTQLIVFTSLFIALLTLAGRQWQLLLNTFILAQCILLIYLSFSHDDENFWLHSLAILACLNYFVIPKLVERYSVPRQELLSVSLIFQNFFLTKSVF